MNLNKSVEGKIYANISTTSGEDTKYELSPLTLADFSTTINVLKQIKETKEVTLTDALNFLCYDPFGLRVCFALAAQKNLKDSKFLELIEEIDPEFSSNIQDLALELCGLLDDTPDKQTEESKKK